MPSYHLTFNLRQKMDEVVLSAAAPRGIFVTISLALRFNLPAPHYEPLAHNYSFRIIQKTDKANGAEVYYCEQLTQIYA